MFPDYGQRSDGLGTEERRRSLPNAQHRASAVKRVEAAWSRSEDCCLTRMDETPQEHRLSDGASVEHCCVGAGPGLVKPFDIGMAMHLSMIATHSQLGFPFRIRIPADQPLDRDVHPSTSSYLVPT